MSALHPGLSAEITITVRPEDTAERWGSGLVPVYSTPALVGLMEAAAVKALAGKLEEGRTTVGGHIDIQHLAPTPVGMAIRARAELIAVEGRKLTFRIEAWDEMEKVGEALHERYIIDNDKFVAKALAKKQ